MGGSGLGALYKFTPMPVYLDTVYTYARVHCAIITIRLTADKHLFGCSYGFNTVVYKKSSNILQVFDELVSNSSGNSYVVNTVKTSDHEHF